MDKNVKYILIAAVVAVVVIVAAIALTSQHEVFYDSHGKVDAKSSDLKFEYKNEESIYGAFKADYTLDHSLYYDEAKISGKVKFDMDDVEWDDHYIPDNSTDDDGNEIEHVNDIDYAKNNFSSVVMDDYDNDNVNVTVDVDLQDSDGKSIREHSGYEDELPLVVKSMKLEDGVITLKFKHNYHQDIKNEMFNGPDYNGNLLDSRNKDHKISKAKVTFNFYNDNYHFKVTSVLKGDDFTHKHM
jgi:hypothetical protein